MLFSASILYVFASWFIPVYADGALYSNIGMGLIENHTYQTYLEGDYTWGWSLTYSLYLALVYATFGLSIYTTKIASMVAMLLSVVAVYYCTKDLFGKKKGFVTATIFAFNPWLIYFMGMNYAESFVILFSALFFWAFFKVPKSDKYYLPASVLGVLLLYTRSNIGIPLILPTIVAFAFWSGIFEKREYFKRPYFYIFIVTLTMGIFLRYYFIQMHDIGINQVRYLSGFSSMGLLGAVRYVVNISLIIFMPLIFYAFFVPETGYFLRNFKNRNNNLTILLLIGTIGIIVVHTAGKTGWFKPINGPGIRYFFSLSLPFVWVILQYLDFEREKPPHGVSELGKRILLRLGNNKGKLKTSAFVFFILTSIFVAIALDPWWGLIFLFGTVSMNHLNNQKYRAFLIVVAFVLAGIGFTFVRVPQDQLHLALPDAHDRIEPGSSVGIVRTETGYPTLKPITALVYLGDLDVEIYDYNETSDKQPDYILSHKSTQFENYTLVKEYKDPKKTLFVSDWILEITKQFQGDDAELPYGQPTIYLWEKNPE